MRSLQRCLSVLILVMTLVIPGAAGIGVVRCTMPDGRQVTEGVAAALRCRAELTRAAEAPAVPAIGGVCHDELIATAQGDLASERETDWAALAAPSLRPFADPRVQDRRFARHSSDPYRGRAAALRRCVVLQI